MYNFAATFNIYNQTKKMNGITKTLRYIAVALLFTATTASAQTLAKNETSGLPRTTTQATEQATTEINYPTRPFAFGVEAGANIDFSSTESSCFDIDIYAGYRKGIVQIAGVGMGIHPSFANNRLFIPIYAMFRCNFKEGRSLCFADIKAGLSINELSSKSHNTGAYASAGIGFNLLQTRKLKTYVLVGYTYTQIIPFGVYSDNALHGANIRIGINF